MSLLTSPLFYIRFLYLLQIVSQLSERESGSPAWTEFMKSSGQISFSAVYFLVHHCAVSHFKTLKYSSLYLCETAMYSVYLLYLFWRLFLFFGEIVLREKFVIAPLKGIPN